jgi:chorismate mutase
MKLDIQPVSQRNPAWKDKKMGGGGTIGLYGCLLTCHAMSLTYYGHPTTPDQLNELFKSKNCYDGNFLNFYAVGGVYGDYKASEMYDCYETPCDLGKIDKLLSEKKPVIAMVDFDVNPSTKGDWHFVLIIGKENDSYFINDPWTGETYYFEAKYGDPSRNIYGLRIYEGNPPQTVNPQDEIEGLREKIQSLNEDLSDKALEISELTKEVGEAKNESKTLNEQLNKCRSERDKADWEATQSKLQVEKLTEEKKVLTDKVAELEKTKGYKELFRIGKFIITVKAG